MRHVGRVYVDKKLQREIEALLRYLLEREEDEKDMVES